MSPQIADVVGGKSKAVGGGPVLAVEDAGDRRVGIVDGESPYQSQTRRTDPIFDELFKNGSNRSVDGLVGMKKRLPVLFIEGTPSSGDDPASNGK